MAEKKPIDWIIHIVKNGVCCADCGGVENSFLDCMCNAHTHGMEKYNHMDFQLVLALPNEEIGRILNTFGLMVQKGHRFYNGQYVLGIYEDCSVRLMQFNEGGRDVLRVVIPDKTNTYPESPNCGPFYKLQHLSTEALQKAEYIGLKAKFAEETEENIGICPYCGEDQGHFMDGYDEARYRCDDCGQDYYIQFNSESWSEEDGCYTVVEDVTDRHRKSLLKNKENQHD